MQGNAAAATVVDYTVHGFKDNTPVLLANGQLAATTTDMLTAGAAEMVITSVILVNTDSSDRAVNLFILPDGGTARRM